MALYLSIAGLVVATVLASLWTRAAVRAALAEAEARDLCRDVAAWREREAAATAEVKRLTDVIIRMRDEGKALHPMHEDEQWGSYVIDDELELEEEQRRARASGRGAAYRQTREIDDEFRKLLADF